MLSTAGQERVRREGIPAGGRPGTPVGTVEGATDPANPFPVPNELLTIGEASAAGGAVNGKFFDETSGIVPQDPEGDPVRSQ